MSWPSSRCLSLSNTSNPAESHLLAPSSPSLAASFVCGARPCLDREARHRSAIYERPVVTVTGTNRVTNSGPETHEFPIQPPGSRYYLCSRSTFNSFMIVAHLVISSPKYFRRYSGLRRLEGTGAAARSFSLSPTF